MTDSQSTWSVERERRWLVLGEDGRHAWLGRATDPSEQEILEAEAGLVRQGLSGWLAVSEGVYYSADTMTVLEVRTLGNPASPFADAAQRFHDRRTETLRGLPS